MEVGGPVPSEPVVSLACSVEDNTLKRLIVVVNGVFKKNSCMLRVGWVHCVGVDFIVDTGSGCNLVSTLLCKRLGVEIDSQQKTLVGFSRDMRVPVVQAWSQTQLGEWKQKMCFHVVNGRVQPILGYPWLKSL